MSDSFDIFLDDDNELRFGVTVEGAEASKFSCRMILESPGVSFAFNGRSLENNEIEVIVPKLKNMLSEGTYNTKLEVIIDDKIFVPLEIPANLKKSVKIQAESIVRNVKSKPTVSVTVINSKKEEAPVAPNPVQEKPQVTENKNTAVDDEPKIPKTKKIKKQTNKIIESKMKKIVAGDEKETRDFMNWLFK